ncbi:hypothetical protein [Wolbachia endosymbiont (group E) of Neria commutata]|uniref:hypothetical protein n=1 Tax=Wolbachia endosymbiont (group E) of Neria commutata TaxID=3066149 RepID=UPI00313341A7
MVLCDDELFHIVKKVGEFISKGSIENNNLTLLVLTAEYGHLDIARYILDKALRLWR